METMISFDVLGADNARKIVRKLQGKSPDMDADYVLDIAEQLSASADGCEYALSVVSGCLLIRVFEDEYFFLYPEPIGEASDILEAVGELRLYSIREEIGLVISEVPKEDVEDLCGLFAKSEVSAEDASGELFTVRALSEISLLDELPQVYGEHLALTPLYPRDEKKYAALCRDTETNKYWGYNYCDDAPDCADSYFLESAETEFSRGVAASFAVRVGDELIGEAILYAFDYLGGAECAVRLLPEYRGRGLSGEAVELLCDLARGLHILRLYATVDGRNEPSIRLFSKCFALLENKGESIRFLREM